MEGNQSRERTREEAVARFKARMGGGTVEGGEELELNYAGFWRRFVALIIDSIILGFVGGIFIVIVRWIYPQAGSIMGNIIGIVYTLAFWTFWGQTPGKMVMGVTIVKADGAPIGFGRAILRYVGYWVSTIILCIGYLMIAWDSKKQGLHDKIAGTYVVKTS